MLKSQTNFSPSVPQVQPAPRASVAPERRAAPPVVARSDVVRQIAEHSVMLFVTILGKADAAVSHLITANQLWDWTFMDVVAKFAPKEYLEAQGTTYELWDVLLDKRDVIVKPGTRILGYHILNHQDPQYPMNIQCHKELIVIPMRAQGQSPDQQVPDIVDVDAVPSKSKTKPFGFDQRVRTTSLRVVGGICWQSCLTPAIFLVCRNRQAVTLTMLTLKIMEKAR